MSEEPSLRENKPSPRLYEATLKSVPAALSTLLREYSDIPVDAQRAHITRIRDEAYEKYPYPCLGRWRFLDLDLSSHPLYHTEILPALTAKEGNQKDSAGADADWEFLDLGCCLGQDIRKLIFDGADPSRLLGADLRPEFIDIGYSLFRDKDTFPPSHFGAPADVFDFSPSSPLAQLDGKVGILHACAVFHLFDLDGQKTFAQRVLRLLSPRRKKVLLVGGQAANINAGVWGEDRPRYRHNEDSWQRFWEEAVSEKEWIDKVQGVEVESVLEARTFGSGDKTSDSNTTQRQIGALDEGFRWMKWSVWVTFR
jgi:SAM-dependent methyltransferase